LQLELLLVLPQSPKTPDLYHENFPGTETRSAWRSAFEPAGLGGTFTLALIGSFRGY
jgi:hypothetical protein